MLQTERRRNPYPYTWEIPVGVAIVVLLVALIGVHAGRGLAGVFAGAGWVWPPSRTLFSSLPGVLTGNPAAGLPAGTRMNASPAQLTGGIITVEVLLLAVAITAAIWVVRRWGPNRMKGMAAADEAEAILGVSRLRSVAPIIRPDLYGAQTTITSRNGDHDGYHPHR